MDDRFLNIINCREYFRDRIDDFKEAFVKYYGEEYRDEINSKFDSTTMIAYYSPDTKNRIVFNALNDKTKKLCNRLINEINLDLTNDDLLSFYSFDTESFTPIYNLSLLFDLLEMSEEEKTEYFINIGFNKLKGFVSDLTIEEYKHILLDSNNEKIETLPPLIKNNIRYYCDSSNFVKELDKIYGNCEPLLHKIDSKISLDNVINYREQLKNISNKYKEIAKEYKDYSLSFNDYQIEIEKEKDREQQTKKKYLKKIITDNMEFIPEDETDFVTKYLNDENEYLLDAKKTSYIFGISPTSEPAISSFGSEDEEKLQNENTSEWIKNSIIKDRIKYFNLYGFNLGDNYELYLNNDECKKIWPNKEKIDLYLEKRKKRLNEYNIDYYENYNDYKRIKEEIDSTNVLDHETGFGPQVYTLSANTMVCPNVVKENDTYKLHSFLYINLDNYTSGTIDHFIAHELNHVFELHLKNANDKEYEFICGWDYGSNEFNQEEEEINTLQEDRNKRPYELVNEIINELIAQDISEIMINSNSIIFDDKEKIQYKNTTSYEYMLFLIKDFYKEFKDVILESRKNGNISLLFDEIGKENFDEFSELFQLFNNTFSGSKVVSLRFSLKNHEENELTKAYEELKNRRDEILNNMRSYKMDKEQGNNYHK